MIVDDEPEAIENCRRLLSRSRYICVVEADAQRALAVLERERPQVLLTDLRMPGLDGLALLKAAKRIDPTIKVVLLTAYASLQTAVASMRHGAFDYLAKPFTGKELRSVIRRALGAEEREAIEMVPAGLPRAPWGSPLSAAEPVLAGRGPEMQAVRAAIELVAETEAAVLLTGERGTGKARMARVIHAGSLRRAKHVVSVDCVTSSDALLDGELFGSHPLPGVSGDRAGMLESADGGTLFLDEVGGLSLRLQAKLLRALKERRARRVNGGLYYSVDTRVVASSSRNLQAACGEGAFREDLYQHLNVVPIAVPPLRQRLEDIDQLSRLFMEPFWLRMQQPLPAVFGFAPEALAKLCRYAWPGNLQELQQVVERAVVLADGPLFDSASLPDHLQTL